MQAGCTLAVVWMQACCNLAVVRLKSGCSLAVIWIQTGCNCSLAVVWRSSTWSGRIKSGGGETWRPAKVFLCDSFQRADGRKARREREEGRRRGCDKGEGRD